MIIDAIASSCPSGGAQYHGAVSFFQSSGNGHGGGAVVGCGGNGAFFFIDSPPGILGAGIGYGGFKFGVP